MALGDDDILFAGDLKSISSRGRDSGSGGLGVLNGLDLKRSTRARCARLTL